MLRPSSPEKDAAACACSVRRYSLPCVSLDDPEAVVCARFNVLEPAARDAEIARPWFYALNGSPAIRAVIACWTL